MSHFSQQLLAWYSKNARAMPWRIPPENHALGERADPYFVWLSEVMLQQTQVATVRDYFIKFTQKWPTVEYLSACDLEDVLKAWAGLGYYSRARNLKKCADEIVNHHNGHFPNTFEELKKLPGIGDYTASAIASIAFDQPVPVIDGNIERVMARHQRIESFFPDAKKETKEILVEILDPDKPGEFAQAMMDLGATICTQKRPACGICPLREDCLSAHREDVETFPKKRPKQAKPTRKGAAFVIENKEGKIFLCKRPDAGLLGGMTQVPTTDWNSRQDGQTGASAAPIMSDWHKKGIAMHTFTHFHLELEVWHSIVNADIAIKIQPVSGWWCEKQLLEQEALPTVMRKVLALAIG